LYINIIVISTKVSFCTAFVRLCLRLILQFKIATINKQGQIKAAIQNGTVQQRTTLFCHLILIQA